MALLEAVAARTEVAAAGGGPLRQRYAALQSTPDATMFGSSASRTSNCGQPGAGNDMPIGARLSDRSGVVRCCRSVSGELDLATYSASMDAWHSNQWARTIPPSIRRGCGLVPLRPVTLVGPRAVWRVLPAVLARWA